jgi:hypothetical protein
LCINETECSNIILRIQPAPWGELMKHDSLEMRKDILIIVDVMKEGMMKEFQFQGSLITVMDSIFSIIVNKLYLSIRNI